MTEQMLFIIIGAGLGIMFIIFIIIIFSFKKQLRLFTAGKNGTSLESTMQTLLLNQKNLEHELQELADFATDIHHRVVTSHRGFSIKKYNAYDHVGGNQSFSIALLDENGDGMVLSSLYSRERSNVFAKNITQFATDQNLTTEEVQVLQSAKKSLGKK